MTLLHGLEGTFDRRRAFTAVGKVRSLQGAVIAADLPAGAVGDLCFVSRSDGSRIPAEIVSFTADGVVLAPFEPLAGISPGASVSCHGGPLEVCVTSRMKGRIVNCFGLPIDGGTNFTGATITGHLRSAPPPLSRPQISQPLETGIAVIDALATLGIGQRIGLFSPPGVGKSTLLGMICRHAEVDVVVVGLIGERGREVREFIDDCLGAAGLERAIVVVSTSDEMPIRRFLAADTATVIAEFFRDRGQRVLLLLDSLSRACRALRDVGLATGELPIRQGYPPSVYVKLPALLERAGNSFAGSITAVYTVLTNGDGEEDPLGEEIKSILDGHIVLSARLAEQGVRPAVDPTLSISRLMARLHPQEYLNTASRALAMLGRLKRDKDLLLLGGTADSELSRALESELQFRKLFTQLPHEKRSAAATKTDLMRIIASAEAMLTADQPLSD